MQRSIVFSPKLAGCLSSGSSRLCSPTVNRSRRSGGYLEVAAAGGRAAAMVSLRDEPSGDSRHCEVAVDAVAGHPGYRLWRLRNVSASTPDRGGDPRRAERALDLLDNAPIGIYSVDGSGRFRYVNQTLAQWLGTTPSEMLGSGARLLDFLASGPRRPRACRPYRPGGRHASEIVLKQPRAE